MSGSLSGEEDDIRLKCIDMTCLEDTVGCEAWTWTDEDNQIFANHCWMFSQIGELRSYGDCVREGSREFQRKFFIQLRISLD